MENDRKLKVFISYASQDTPKARELYQRLSDDGFTPWMDRMNLRPGDQWKVVMEQAINESDVIVACLSNNSINKEGYIQEEYRIISELAQEKPSGTIFIIPLRLEDCSVPNFFRRYHWLDYFDKNGYEILRQSLLRRAEQLRISVTSPISTSSNTTANTTASVGQKFAPPGLPLQEIRRIENQTERAKALIESAKQSPEYLLGDILVEGGQIQDEKARADVIIALVPILSERRLHTALEIANSINDQDIRGTVLAEIGTRLPEEKLVNFNGNSIQVHGKVGSNINPMQDSQKVTESSSVEEKQSEDVAASEKQKSDAENLQPTNVIRPITIDGDAIDKHVATDKPIQSVKQDKLDFKIYVNALHSFILSKYTTTPITISIDGVWGTGKSSLMSMLKGKLDPQRDGVRKFFEWFAGLRLWLKWVVGFELSYPFKTLGKMLVALIVRDDIDEPGVHLYFGDTNAPFKKFVSDIVEGFSIDPEFLIQDESKSMDKHIRWWARTYANCDPMQPPYHYAVWLNAWKFDNQEEVWASLALATMEQIKQKHGLLWRLRFWWELTFSRFSFWSGLGQVVKQFLLPLVFAIVLASYNTIIKSVPVPLVAFDQYGSPLLWAGFVISGILSVSSIFKDPFQIPLDKVFDRPNYKDKVKFLSHFEKDFARIVRAATKNGFGWKRSKLVIFIDDLDRCEPPKSADIVEAVNLFLDAEGCVFVIGMDSESVARSIEVKYKDLFERMKAENTGVVSLGRLFLDKIVQIPFSVPRPTPQQITSMVNDALGAKVLPLSVNISIGGGSRSPDTGASGAPVVDTSSGQVAGIHTPEQTTDVPPIAQPRIDPASYAKPEVRAAILKGTELLADNPRQVKTFINLFRLSIYIANERKFLEEKIIGEKTSGLNLDKLAVWTACTVRWPGLVRHLYTATQIDSLCQFACDVSQAITPEFRWQTGHKNVPAELKKKIDNLRKAEKGSEAHWCHLPWDWWLLDNDFLKAIKLLDEFWVTSGTGEMELLKVLLTMDKAN